MKYVFISIIIFLSAACDQSQQLAPISVTASQETNSNIPTEIETANVDEQNVDTISNVAIPAPESVITTPTLESISTSSSVESSTVVSKAINNIPPTAITNIKTAPSRLGQDSRITTLENNYVVWAGGIDANVGILKYVVYQYTTNDCSGNNSSVETQNQYISFNAEINETYSFKIKAINKDLLETSSSCSGSIMRISTQTAISNASITINAGDLYTRSTTVTLTLAATNATELYVTNDENCNSGGSWQTYTINKSWVLANSNSIATVYVKYRDSYNRESSCVSDTIIHDSLAPTNPSLSISSNYRSSNAQGYYVLKTQVVLNMSAIDATEMFISNSSCTINGSWEPYSVNKAWVLSQTNSLNNVYVKFKDLAGNETNCISASMRHIDTDAPIQPAIRINWGGTYWNDGTPSPSFSASRNVNLYVYADDIELTHVAISNGTTCNGSWEEYIPNYIENSVLKKAWTLAGTSGMSYVSAKFKDASGNTSGCVTTSVKLVAMDNVADVYAGVFHTCVKSSTGYAKCWGRNDFGQLGYGFSEAINNVSSIGKTPATTGTNSTVINVGNDRTIISLALGAIHTCALLDNGLVKCWGNNMYGQLGLGNTTPVINMGDSLQAVNLGGIAVEIVAGGYHSCARMTTGNVKCWGSNIKGQLGIGSTINVGDASNPMFTNVELGTDKTAIQISAGGDATCALLNDHTVKCWGDNYYNQLGQDNMNYTGDGTFNIGNKPNQLGDNLPSVLVGINKTVNQIAMGPTHACALLNDNGMKCWGSGDGLGYRPSAPVGNSRLYIDLGASSFSITKIAVSNNYSCAVTINGTKCWGSNNYGQLGQGNMAPIGSSNNMYNDSVFPFINLGDNKIVSKISSGVFHSCALFTDKTVKCWGSNGYGQLGIGSTENMGDGLFEMGNFLPEL